MTSKNVGGEELSPLNNSCVENMTVPDSESANLSRNTIRLNTTPDDLYFDAIDETFWQTHDRDTIEGVMEIIHHWADEKEYFDIYQMSAFDSKNGRKNKCNCRVSIPSAIICLILQLPSIIFLVYEMVSDSDKYWCNIDDVSVSDAFRKFLAFGFSAYLTTFIQKSLNEIGYKGMYCVYLATLENLPPFLSGTWLRIGGYYNIVVLHFAIYGSFAVVFFAENIIDLVLNSVALFFITELDDYLVSQIDYNRVKIFIEEYLKQHENNEKDTQQNDSKCVGFWKALECVLKIFEKLIFILAHLVPFYIGVCS